MGQSRRRNGRTCDGEGKDALRGGARGRGAGKGEGEGEGGRRKRKRERYCSRGRRGGNCGRRKSGAERNDEQKGPKGRQHDLQVEFSLKF